MTWQAVCSDCAWTIKGGAREEVTEAVERHSRKEYHHIDLRRAIQARS